MNTKKLIAVMLVVIVQVQVMSQNPNWIQEDACPGWNNPANFGATFYDNTGTERSCYSGQTGTAPSQAPNVLTSTTGITLGTSVYTGTGLSSVTYSYGWGGAGLPSNNNQFYINTTNGNDPNTASGLKYIPSQQFNTNDTSGMMVNTNLTKSIRIGDGNAGGQAAALYYELLPTTDNAIFIIYYAIVVEAPGHGLQEDPAFIIRVMEKTASGSWVQKNDTLAYYITSTPASEGGNVVVGQGGWMQGTPGYGWGDNGVIYKQWTKVVINLANCLYQPTRIEMMVRDCQPQGHYAYAYVCGECREMTLQQSGCPAGMETRVASLWAPRGMLEYEWSASEYGHSEPVTDIEPGEINDYFTFRQLSVGSDEDGYYKYDVEADDFRVLYRPTGAGGPQVALTDSVGNIQTFRCLMKSAIDPNKPFYTPLYMNVRNTKPTMRLDSLYSCDGTVSIWNRSYVPGDPTLVVDSTTTYSFYHSPNGEGSPYAVLTGDSIVHNFDENEIQTLIVRTNTVDSTCYSEALYNMRPRRVPNASFTVSKHVLCDAEEATLTDNSGEVSYREWTFVAEGSNYGDSVVMYDTVYGYSNSENRTLTRGFLHSIEPVKLMVRNGDYVFDSFILGDTVWCESSYTDTLAVFLHPDLEVTGDTIVCQGSMTDAQVRAIGVDGCTYEWSRSYGSMSGDLPTGDRLQVVPYADKSVYYVRVTSPQGCVAWDSIHAYLVRPRVSVEPGDGRICPGTVAVLTGHDADHYTWSASPADPTLNGQENTTSISVSPSRTTVYTMVGHGSNDCDASPLTQQVTVLPLAEPQVTLYPDYIDMDDPQITLRDVSKNRNSSLWTFNDGETATGEEVHHYFNDVVGHDSVGVKLTVYNELNCGVEYPFAVPVLMFTAWFPNAFTPGSEDENARFRLYSINEYEYFRIYIYDRMGRLVFSSDDPRFEWDGTSDGQPCVQGAYTYVCNFRKPGTPTLDSRKGAVTLIR